MAATCGGSLDHIFEKPILPPENPTLVESLSSWNQIKHNNLDEKDSSFSNYTELFGELHFKDNHHHHHHVLQSSSSSSSVLSPPPPPLSLSQEISKNNSPDQIPTSYHYHYPNQKQYRDHNSTDTASFSSSIMNSESLSLCTEGLGIESYDDVDECFDFCQEKMNSCKESKKSRTTSKGGGGGGGGSFGSFPPPISCIGKTGKPWVSFKSYRQDGRFILQEIRIPIQETLHACREDGRLKLHFIQSESEESDDDELLQQGDVENGEIDGEKEKEKISSNNEDCICR